MPRALEEQVMFASSAGDEYEDWEDLFNRLVSFASTKRSFRIIDKPLRGGKKDDAMDIGAFGKGGDRKANVQCWNCHAYGHYGKAWPKKGGQGVGKGTAHHSGSSY